MRRGSRAVFLLLTIVMTSLACVAKNPVSYDDIEFKQFDTDNVSFSYLQRLGQGEAIVVFLHGTPGEAEAFGEYLYQPWLMDRAALVVSINRPAWESSLLKNTDKKALSLAEQSHEIGKLLSAFDAQLLGAPIVIVGHSLGGALVARLLGDHSSLIDAGLILAGPLDAELSRSRWYHKAAKASVVKALIGSNLRRSNLEMLMLEDDVKASAKNYSKITMPITIIQGGKDPLVNVGNADVAEAEWPQATVVRLPESGHFLPWQQQPLIVSHIKQLIDLASMTQAE